LPATISGRSDRLGSDIKLAAVVRAAVLAARVMDYVAAAAAAEQLRKLVDARPAGAATLRARHALALLDSAGLTLTDNEWGSDEQPSKKLPATNTAYADYLAVKLADDSAAEWPKRRKRIAARLSKERIALLDAMHSPEGSCPTFSVPPVERVSDLVFSGRLSLALDVDVAPGDKPAARQLSLEAWLPRYEKAVELMQRSGSTWSFVANMLNQRGEQNGLSAAGTNTYRKLTELALRHMEALGKLANAHPARFQALGVVTLVYLPTRIAKSLVDDDTTSLWGIKVVDGVIPNGLRLSELQEFYLAATLAVFLGSIYMRLKHLPEVGVVGVAADDEQEE